MTIIEYTLDPQAPSYVDDGGYWLNPDDSDKLIGVGVEGSIPDNITTFTLEELQARQLAIHVAHPMYKSSPNMTEIMTNDEVIAAVKTWVDTR